MLKAGFFFVRRRQNSDHWKFQNSDNFSKLRYFFPKLRSENGKTQILRHFGCLSIGLIPWFPQNFQSFRQISSKVLWKAKTLVKINKNSGQNLQNSHQNYQNSNQNLQNSDQNLQNSDLNLQNSDRNIQNSDITTFKWRRMSG